MTACTSPRMTGPGGIAAGTAGDCASRVASKRAFIPMKAQGSRKSAQRRTVFEGAQESRRMCLPGVLGSWPPAEAARSLVIGLLLGRRAGLHRLRRLQLQVVLRE